MHQSLHLCECHHQKRCRSAICSWATYPCFLLAPLFARAHQSLHLFLSSHTPYLSAACSWATYPCSLSLRSPARPPVRADQLVPLSVRHPHRCRAPQGLPLALEALAGLSHPYRPFPPECPAHLAPHHLPCRPSHRERPARPEYLAAQAHRQGLSPLAAPQALGCPHHRAPHCPPVPMMPLPLEQSPALGHDQRRRRHRSPHQSRRQHSPQSLVACRPARLRWAQKPLQAFPASPPIARHPYLCPPAVPSVATTPVLPPRGYRRPADAAPSAHTAPCSHPPSPDPPHQSRA